MPAVRTLKSNIHQGKFDATCVIVPVSDGGKTALTNKVSTGTNSDSRMPNPTAVNINFQDRGFQPIVVNGNFSMLRVKNNIPKASPQSTAKSIKVETGSSTLGLRKNGLITKT